MGWRFLRGHGNGRRDLGSPWPGCRGTGPSACRQLTIDGREDGRPLRWRQAARQFFEGCEGIDIDGRAEQRVFVRGNGGAGSCPIEEPGVDADHLADISGQGMLNRSGPLNPIIFPHTPQRRNTDRGICRSEIVGMEHGEHHIAASSERIEAARSPLLWRKVSSAAGNQPVGVQSHILRQLGQRVGGHGFSTIGQDAGGERLKRLRRGLLLQGLEECGQIRGSARPAVG